MCNFVLRVLVVENKFEYCKMHTPPGNATAGTCSRLVFLLDHHFAQYKVHKGTVPGHYTPYFTSTRYSYLWLSRFRLLAAIILASYSYNPQSTGVTVLLYCIIIFIELNTQNFI